MSSHSHNHIAIHDSSTQTDLLGQKHEHNMHMMMGMNMAFHFGTNETILFGFWHISSAIGLFFSSILIIAFCFFLEFVRWYRLFHKKQYTTEILTNHIQQTVLEKLNLNFLVDITLHIIQLALSYFLMLIVMTFNIWLCIAVVLGEALARALLHLFFPQLDLISETLATSEDCC